MENKGNIQVSKMDNLEFKIYDVALMCTSNIKIYVHSVSLQP